MSRAQRNAPHANDPARSKRPIGVGRRCALLAAGVVLALPQSARADTEIISRAAAKQLLGRHLLSLQWISWDQFGTATVTDSNGTLRLTGRQALNGDYLTIDGVIRTVKAKEFDFEGVITTRVSHINGGEPCRRRGVFTFAAKGTRKYWRMQSIESPCDEVADYVDVYFGRK